MWGVEVATLRINLQNCSWQSGAKNAVDGDRSTKTSPLLLEKHDAKWSANCFRGLVGMKVFHQVVLPDMKDAKKDIVVMLDSQFMDGVEKGETQQLGATAALCQVAGHSPE